MNTHLTPMRVESVRTSLLNIPLVRPHVTSVARIQYQSLVLVRVRTTDGVEGFGEAVVPGGPWWSGDSIEGIEALIQRDLAPLLIGEDAANIDFQIQRLNRLVPGAHFAKAGVDMALLVSRTCLGEFLREPTRGRSEQCVGRADCPALDTGFV